MYNTCDMQSFVTGSCRPEYLGLWIEGNMLKTLHLGEPKVRIEVMTPDQASSYLYEIKQSI